MVWTPIRGREALTEAPHGSVVVSEMSQLDISATDIREQIATGQSPHFNA